MNIPGLVGTIAGDDTAFLALKDPDAAVKLYHEIEQLL
jgi:arginine repressor